MKLLVILPVKNLDESKSRLSPLLTQEARRVLALTLLKRTIRILISSRYVEDILLISQDKEIQAVSRREAVLFLREKGRGLNQALEQATRWSIRRGYGAVLILPLDVPLLTKGDIENIVSLGIKEERLIVIAPDHDQRGTNALLVKPPGIFRYQFEGCSFVRHLEQAKDGRISSEIYISHSLGFDVDYPSKFYSMESRGLD